jgi:hypothetical protein
VSGIDALYLTDAEISARLGLQPREWAGTVKALEKASAAFPRPDPLFGYRRYWPAIVAFLDARNGLAARSVEPSAESLERWSA